MDKVFVILGNAKKETKSKQDDIKKLNYLMMKIYL